MVVKKQPFESNIPLSYITKFDLRFSGFVCQNIIWLLLHFVFYSGAARRWLMQGIAFGVFIWRMD